VSDLALAARQVRFTNAAFWRNPASAFFTFVFPLMFLVIFTTLLGNDIARYPTTSGVVEIRQSTFYVAGMAAFGVITACYTNIAMSVTFARDAGILKRLRGSPVPGSVYMIGRVVHATLIATILVVLCSAFGAAFYHAAVPGGADLARALAALVVGAASFCALGLACTTIVPNADAAPAIVNATILPILFVSDVFINTKDAPGWIRWLGDVFPVKHFAQALQAVFIPQAVPWSWIDVLVVAAWGVAGLVVATRFFSWEPRR
jgi:ABC-2 type transport system permease protein